MSASDENATRKGGDKTAATRNERKRNAKREIGLKRVECWVIPEDEHKLKEIERQSQEKAKAV